VLELRSLGANVTPPSFPAFALNVFDLITAVNSKHESEYEPDPLPVLHGNNPDQDKCCSGCSCNIL
jgi:hypothetical protein